MDVIGHDMDEFVYNYWFSIGLRDYLIKCVVRARILFRPMFDYELSGTFSTNAVMI